MNKKGFTLIELLVTISIITVLSMVGLSVFSGTQSQARDSIRKRDLNTLAQALEIYYQKNGRYVLPASNGNATCNRDTAAFKTAMKSYMSDNKVPQDPSLKCSFSDLVASFGSWIGRSNYNKNCDFNNDRLVDSADFSIGRASGIFSVYKDYCYISLNNGGSYRLFTKLENPKPEGNPIYNCSYYNYSLTSNDLTIIHVPEDSACSI